MISTIRHFIDSKLSNKTADSDSSEGMINKIDLICAALMIEVMDSDHQLDDREHEEFLRVLQEQYKVSEEDLHDISALAQEEARQATSLYEFTRLINDEYDYQQKVSLIENMWRIAFSDSET